jgi:hypothetical protein
VRAAAHVHKQVAKHTRAPRCIASNSGDVSRACPPSLFALPRTCTRPTPAGSRVSHHARSLLHLFASSGTERAQHSCRPLHQRQEATCNGHNQRSMYRYVMMYAFNRFQQRICVVVVEGSNAGCPMVNCSRHNAQRNRPTAPTIGCLCCPWSDGRELQQRLEP